MSFISTVPVNAAGPVANTLPVAVMQAMGAAGSNPTAKLLLPQAVTAPVLVQAFTADVPRAPAKTMPRITTNQPLSTLAAQLLAQSPETTPEQVALFTPRPQNSAQQPVQQQANPNQTPVTNNTQQPATPAPVAAPQQAPAPAQTATVIPLMTQATMGSVRKPTNDHAGNQTGPVQSRERVSNSTLRGTSAYQSASRMHGEKNQYAIEAVG